jgi:purine-binding chemotaxis protein CheW
MIGDATAVRFGRNRSAPRANGGDEASRTSWLLCRAGTILGALPIEHVVEIMRPLPIEQITGAPEYVRGLSVIRGAPVPVIDVGLLLGGAITSCTRLVAIKAATRTIALAVDEVIGITGIAADALGQLPPLLRDAATDAIAAIGALDSELIVFLRTGRLVPEDVFARLDAHGATS